MKTLKISSDPEFTLPLEVVTQTFAVLAKRRVGKTYTASVLVEEMMKAKLPVVIVDPTDAWYGLRSSADGKREGFPVVIIGGRHADVPLEPTSGKVLADLVIDHPGFYVLCTKRLASKAEEVRLVGDFLERLYKRKADHPFAMHMVFDEADIFAPQKMDTEGQKRTLSAISAIIRRGGIDGIGTTIICQRPALLNKDVLTQSDNLIVLRITGPQDREAVEDWAKGYGTKEQRDEVLTGLASLGEGEAWFWSPGPLDIFQKINIRARETFNSSATPKPGETVIQPQRLAAVDLDKLRDKIASTIEKAKADDPKLLRARIADLEMQREAVADIKTPQQINAAVAEARKELVNLFAEKEAGYQNRIKALEGQLLAFRELAMKLPIEPACPYDRALDVKLAEALTAPVVKTVHTTRQEVQRRPVVNRQPSTIGEAAEKHDAQKSLSKSEQKILDSLAWWASVGITEPSRAQVAFAAGYTVSGHFNNLLGTLRTRELLDYPQGDCAGLTDAGNALANHPAETANRPELYDRIRQKLSEPQRRLFNVLLEAEGILSNEELASRGGYTVSGHFNNLRGSLRTLQLAEYVSGGTVASEWLFSI